MKNTWHLRKLLVVVVLLSSAFAGDKANYRIVNTFKLGGDGGWDYLTFDADNNRLFIARATRVMVIDADSGKSLGEIPDTPGVHGVALAPGLGRGFSSNGREGTVSIFDFKTLKLIAKVKVGDNPDAILYDPATKRVFTFNGRSHDSTVIDATKGEVLGTIKLDGKPEFAVSDEKGEIFVNIENKSEVEALDAGKMEVKSRWPLAPCESPSGLAIDLKNRRLFSGCDNRLMTIVDADSGKVAASLPIGEGVDAIKFDAETGMAFASCGDGTMTVIHEDSPGKFTALETVRTQKGARTMALDLKTHRAFTVTANFGPPPAPAADQPHPRPAILPDSFVVLVLGR